MNYQETFKPEIRNIYAAHGKSAPSDTVVLAVWDRVKDFPDAFMAWAAARLRDEEKLPPNVGLELERNLYPAWRAETGQPRQRRHCCPDCDPQMPGFFYVWRLETGGYVRCGVQRCLCNNDPAFGAMPAASKAHAARNGGIVMPRDFAGGPAAFERGAFERSVCEKGAFEKELFETEMPGVNNKGESV